MNKISIIVLPLGYKNDTIITDNYFYTIYLQKTTIDKILTMPSCTNQARQGDGICGLHGTAVTFLQLNTKGIR